ncbi:MAG: glycosyltransferase family 2 protein [Fretibacterium sp.]|nr:glycosyltransferase family 2 protein [Fretibacterium sp.]
MRCGVVILNYNDFETTRALVEHIRGFDQLDAIAVVDNCSTDGSYERLRDCEGGKVRVLLSPRNGGYAFGNNIGARYLLEHAGVDLIAIANPDISFENELVAKIKKLFQENPDYAIITGLQLNAEGKPGKHPFWEERTASGLFRDKISSISYVGTNLMLLFAKQLFKNIQLLAKSPVQKKYEAYLSETLKRHSSFFQTGAVEGALFFINSRDFEGVGLFDENTFLYHEEDILSKRVGKLGKKVGVDPTISFVHYGSHTTDKILLSRTMRQHGEQSENYFASRYVFKNKLTCLIYRLLCKIEMGLIDAIDAFVALKQRLRRTSVSPESGGRG